MVTNKLSMAKANLNENYDNKTDFEDGFSMCY